jgi:predicted metalloprotease with PDZ domain
LVSYFIHNISYLLLITINTTILFMLKKKLLLQFLCLGLFMGLLQNAVAQKLSYTLSFEAPQTHYCEVQIMLEDVKGKYTDFKMPSWAPGSYLIREFARHVEQEKAMGDKNSKLKVEKITKNTWRVYHENSTKIMFSYKVYAFEMSVRTSFIDASHGYINGTSVFMYADGLTNLAATLTVKPFNTWKEISTGLSPVGSDRFVLKVPNYDILADSPIEIGNQKIYKFIAAGIPHEVAVYGGGNYNETTFTRDITRIIDEATSIFGENPCNTAPFDHYTFLVYSLSKGGGGLEHLNSTSLMQPRFMYQGSGYEGFLSLVAHEYFHLWNVKRLRPKPLGPFDYDNENYTKLLWVAEGITSYYDNLITFRAGYMHRDGYKQTLVNVIANHENSPGSKVQSVAESSFDAWIKGYRPNENSRNSTISYYGSGTVMASLLDLEILGATKGQKNLDAVMSYMYQEYYKKNNRGYTDEEFQKACEQIAGKPLTIFKHIYSTEPINYDQYLNYAGLRLGRYPKDETNFGANLSDDEGKIMVKSVEKGSAAYNDDINVNDEIIAIDGNRMLSASFALSYANSKYPGENMEVLISRDNIIMNIVVTAAKSNSEGFRFLEIEKTDETQRLILSKWLGGKK